MKLSGEQQRILHALRQGCHLKVHRTLDGAKVYRLHGPAASGGDGVEVLEASLVETLEQRGYLRSNMKFPAATLLLTEKGAQAVATPSPLHPVGPRGY